MKYYQIDNEFDPLERIIENFLLQNPFCQLFWSHTVVIFNFISRITILTKFIYVFIYL